MTVSSEPPDRAEPPELLPDQKQAIVRSLSDWARRHPEPNRPVWGVVEDDLILDMLSPRELVEAVETENPAGMRFLRGVRITLIEISFDDYLRSIDRSATLPVLIEALLGIWDRALELAELAARRFRRARPRA